MKVIPAFLIILLSSAASFSQSFNPAEVKFNGIGLSSTYAEVLRAIGKPTSETRARKEECTGGKEKTARYPGLELYFLDGTGPDGKTFEVNSFEITSNRWIASGIKIGDAEAAVKQKFGRKYTVEKDSKKGTVSWFYDMGDTDGPGVTAVVFKAGKVIKISSSFTIC